MEYEKLLDKAYKEVKVVSSSSDRFETPKVVGKIEGKNTIITNFQQIAQYIRRPAEHLLKFLLKELATSGKIDKDRAIFNTKLNSQKVNEKIEMYVREFVICPVCGKPDTEMLSEKGIKLKNCLACGAKNPIKYHI
jgi:translation initiation factor 2 subunit 2